MPKGMVFWLIFIILAIFGVFWNYPGQTQRPFWPNLLIVLILIALLGWAVFGAVIH